MIERLVVVAWPRMVVEAKVEEPEVWVMLPMTARPFTVAVLETLRVPFRNSLPWEVKVPPSPMLNMVLELFSNSR